MEPSIRSLFSGASGGHKSASCDTASSDGGSGKLPSMAWLSMIISSRVSVILPATLIHMFKLNPFHETNDKFLNAPEASGPHKTDHFASSAGLLQTRPAALGALPPMAVPKSRSTPDSRRWDFSRTIVGRCSWLSPVRRVAGLDQSDQRWLWPLPGCVRLFSGASCASTQRFAPFGLPFK